MKASAKNYTEACQEDEDSKIPMNGQFDLQITELPESAETQAGDPKMIFKLEIVNSSNPIFNGRKINYHAKIDSIFFTRIARAYGYSWEGSEVDTDDCASQVFNKTAKANVTQKSPEDFPNVRSFVY
jgi:hypothetical protein|tara:strand:+ start:7064 stop:7444 length:381 start_codon:yes stop_codon:yes gene_type:complete